jgi:hypothetical protein
MIVFLCLAALVVALAGCGGGSGRQLSTDEYEQQMTALQEDITQSLKDASDRLGATTKLDYYELEDLRSTISESAKVFQSAGKQARDMNIPPEAGENRQQFLDFYSVTGSMLNEIGSDIAFFRGVLPMLTDVGNLALPNMVRDAEVARIKAAAAEDASSMHSYEKDLQGMNPPHELDPYKGTLNNFFRSIENAVADVDRAITPEDRSDFLAFQQDFEGMLQQKQVYTQEMLVYIMNFKMMVDYLSTQAQGLGAKLGVSN